MAQTITVVAAVLVPLAVAVMVFWIADRDFNTAVGILQASDPFRVAFVALLVVMPVVVTLPSVAWVFLDRMFADWKKTWHLIAGSVAVTAATAVVLTGWVVGSILAVLFLVALALRWAVANGASRRAIGTGLFLIGWFYFLMLQFVNPYPEVALELDDATPAVRAYLINQSSDGTWYVPVEETARLLFHPGSAEGIVVCTRRDDPCVDALPAPTPSPSAGSPSSTPEPSSD